MSLAPAEAEGRGDELAAQLARAKLTSARLGAGRVIAFASIVAGAVLAFLYSPWTVPGLSAPASLVFVFLVLRHGPVLRRIEALEAEALLLAERTERVQGRRRARPVPEACEDYAGGLETPPPESFQLEAGVLADLDLLTGPRSLFGFLDASSTWFGAQRLRGMIERPLLDPGAVARRQEAVLSAARNAGFREATLRALLPLRRHDFEAIPAALAAPFVLAGRRALQLWVHLSGSAFPLFLILTFFDFHYAPFLTLCFFVNVATVGLLSKRSNPARDRLLRLGPLLDGFAAARAVLRQHRLPSSWTLAAAALDRVERPGRRLRRRVRLLELHELGILFEAMNVILLWELRFIVPAERVLEKHRESIREAALALGEIEALLSLSLPLVEQTGFSLPEPVLAREPLLDASGLGHPLIESDRLVLNDLRLDSSAPIAIITGSNMSGKSTLLKSVGINLVLAGMGGPVQAGGMRWTPMGLFTDINVRDSLDDGKSYFAVEVERVERIIREAALRPLFLGIFDELFRGTNSAERQAIAMALLAHLRSAGGLYLVATHDLAVTALAEEVPGIVNLHFREEIDGGSMRFDFRLRQGPAPTRNAIRVLEARGYPPKLVEEARARLARIERPGREG